MIVIRKPGFGHVEMTEEAWESHRSALLAEGWQVDGEDPFAVVPEPAAKSTKGKSK